ncbi:MAG: hypothetical protein U0236_03165 [Nitrospira sp.]
MLKATTYMNGDITVVRVEGRLIGPWVDELARHWTTLSGKQVQIDLSDVSFVDDQGKALLVKLHRSGVEPVGEGFLCRGLIEEIISSSTSQERT